MPASFAEGSLQLGESDSKLVAGLKATDQIIFAEKRAHEQCASDLLQGFERAFAHWVCFVIVVIGMLALPCYDAHAQSGLTYFIAGGAQDNFSVAQIEAFDGSTACGVFGNGSGLHSGVAIGMGLPRALSQALGLRIAIRYRDLSSSFVTSPDENRDAPLAFRPSDGEFVPIHRERTYDATLGLLSVAASAVYPITSNLWVDGGLFAGLITNSSYSETEQVTDAGVVFAENGLTHRAIGSGLLAVHTFQAGLHSAIRTSLHFQGSWWIEPSITIDVPFTSISPVSMTAWRMAPVGLSVALSYHGAESESRELPLAATSHLEEPQEQSLQAPQSLPTSKAPPAGVTARPVLRASIAVLDTLGRPIENPRLDVERVHVTEVFPLLHYVFFADGSSSIPSRYEAEGASFDTASLALHPDAMSIYHHLLDIIGERLQANPNATLTLTGTRSLHSTRDSAYGSRVAMDRARSVAAYFEERWNIDATRLQVRSQDLPDAASDDGSASGQAENRRVELSSNTPAVLRPITTERIERIATPPSFIFQPRIVSAAGVQRATIIVQQDGRVLLDANALTGAVSDTYLWTLNSQTMPQSEDSLVYELSVVDSTGQTALATGAIHLGHNVHDQHVQRGDTLFDRTMDRFSLILFDYSSSAPDSAQADALMTLMAHVIRPTSRVTLVGYTDATGDAAFNDKLSADRVSRAAALLKAKLAHVGDANHVIQTEARGSRERLFDNALPEGRLLSRTVRGYIEEDVH